MDDTRRRKCTPWQAVIDSGASDNVVGVNTLQELAEIIGDLGFDVEKELKLTETFTRTSSMVVITAARPWGLRI